MSISQLLHSWIRVLTRQHDIQVDLVARNLYGARMASDRIVPARIKPSLALSSG